MKYGAQWRSLRAFWQAHTVPPVARILPVPYMYHVYIQTSVWYTPMCNHVRPPVQKYQKIGPFSEFETSLAWARRMRRPVGPAGGGRRRLLSPPHLSIYKRHQRLFSAAVIG